MKPLSLNPTQYLCAGFALALAVASSGLAAQATPASAAEQAGEKAADKTAKKIGDYKSNDSVLNKTQVEDALAQIDAELAHLERLADAAPTVEQRADANARYAALEQRRDALRKEFDQARYEAFKSDLDAELARVSSWAKDSFAAAPAAAITAHKASAAADETAAKLTDYQNKSTDLNKAEVRADLARLDADIDLLGAKIDAIQDPDRRAAFATQLGHLKERRSELNHQYYQARYDALKADVKTEWDKLSK